MTEVALKVKKPTIKVDRVNLTPDSVSRLNKWLEQIHSELKGASINRTGLVNWFIESRNDEFSKSEMDEIRKKFNDELKFAEVCKEEFLAARARGEDTSFADIVLRESTKNGLQRAKVPLVKKRRPRQTDSQLPSQQVSFSLEDAKESNI